MAEREATCERVRVALREYREDLLNRIDFLASGRAQIRVRHEEGWVDATEEVVTNLYRQLGDLGALVHELAAPPATPRRSG